MQDLKPGSSMVLREYRRLAHTPIEEDRLTRRACPNCGCERENFQPRNRTAVCCKPACSAVYWQEHHQTRDEMRTQVFKEQGGLCASCKQEIIQDYRHPYVLDHIRPIAMEGSMWDRENLQVLCERCNKQKTARDMGRIAAWKYFQVKEHGTQQITLLEIS